MNDTLRVAVTSRSFSKHKFLRSKILSHFKNVSFNDEGISLKDDTLVQFLKNHDYAITAIEPITDNVLQQLPTLKRISKIGVGTDMIDFDAVKKHQIELLLHKGTNSRSVSELVITLTLNLLRHILPSVQLVKDQKWQQRKGETLTGKTFGIIGYGHVGKDLCTLLKPFSCNILVHDIIETTYSNDDVQAVDLPTLLSSSDIVSVHLPLNSNTKNLLSKEKLSLLKSNAILINTARGGIIDEMAVFQLLESNMLGGAAFDVFSQEPPINNPLMDLPNFIPTPHIAGSTEDAIIAMGEAAIKGLLSNSLR